MKARRRGGYSLIELVFALSLSGIVLLGAIHIVASMMRFSVQGGIAGDISAQSILGLRRMQKEIEGATFLRVPGTDRIQGCNNYSIIIPGALDTSIATTWFHYCVASPASTNGIQSLIRHEGASCADGGVAGTIPAITCGSSPSPYSVMARHVYKVDPNTPFFVMNATGSFTSSMVNVNFLVGIATANVTAGGLPSGTDVAAGSGLKAPTPQALRFQTGISVNKSYGNYSDSVQQ